jgi:hypothetical protein
MRFRRFEIEGLGRLDGIGAAIVYQFSLALSNHPYFVNGMTVDG